MNKLVSAYIGIDLVRSITRACEFCRRVLQVMLTTSRLRVEVSKFVKQEIHSLINYMHSNLTHQQVATTLSRHFAKVSLRQLLLPSLLLSSLL